MKRASELKRWSSATQCMLFCRGSILLTIYAYKGAGGAKRWLDDKGDEGGLESGYLPKVMTSFINCPLHKNVQYSGCESSERCCDFNISARYWHSKTIATRLHTLKIFHVMMVAMTVFAGDDDTAVFEEVRIWRQHPEWNYRDDERNIAQGTMDPRALVRHWAC